MSELKISVEDEVRVQEPVIDHSADTQLIDTSYELLEKKVLSLLTSKLSDLNITVDNQKNLLTALELTMEFVDDDEDDEDLQKKIVNKVLKTYLEKSTVDSDVKNILILLLDDGTLETTMNVILKAAKGELKINKKQKKKFILSCLTGCISALKTSEDKK